MLRAFLNCLLVVFLLLLGAFVQAETGQQKEGDTAVHGACHSQHQPTTQAVWNYHATTTDHRFDAGQGVLVAEVITEGEDRRTSLTAPKYDRRYAPHGAIPAILGAERSVLFSMDVLDQDAFRASAPPAYLSHRAFRI